ncbi:MAG: hypothetical protein QME35_10325 [Thermoanaerobacteraceae bacterium]|nr:hypothetical protein [Thermoanaerobacteraceae bacterium]
MLKTCKKIFTKKIVALLLAMSVLMGGLISASAQTQTSNIQGKGEITTSYSNDMKTLKINRDGRNVLTVTRKNEFDGSVDIKDPKGKISTVAIKVAPLSNNQYNLTIIDMQTSKTFHVTSKINPLADYIFNKNSLKVGNNQQEPDALAYYLLYGKMPDIKDIVISVLGTAAGSYAQNVTNYIMENWEELQYLYSFYGFWAVVGAIATAPGIAGVISGAAIAAIVA